MSAAVGARLSSPEQEQNSHHPDHYASSCDQEWRQVNAPRDAISSTPVAEIE